MDLQMNGDMWICYTCAFEETGKGKVQGEGEAKREQPEPTPPVASMKSDIRSAAMAGVEQKSEILESAAPQDTEFQKKCPMCGGRMDFQIDGEMWLCYTCAHEEAGRGDGQGKSAAKSELWPAPETSPALAVPLEPLSSNKSQDLIRGSIQGSSPSNKRPPTKTKPCPACGKKMGFHENDKAWRCPHCEYERRI
jgi:ribosomal protein L37AE/L43A